MTAESDLLNNRSANPFGDSILLAAGTTPPTACASEAGCAFYSETMVAGSPVYEPQRAVVLEFTPTDYSVPQLVYVGAVNGGIPDGTRTYEISHSVLSADPFYDNVVVRNVEVTKHDTGTPSIQLTNLGDTNTVGVFSDGIGSGSTLSSVSAAFTVVTQVPVPVHPPPDQPAKVELAFGVAVKVTWVPCW